jgi:3-deoxy-D-manno-octulosonate 8-phosphate phosphatase (KDO 8-P phosphatase)
MGRLTENIKKRAKKIKLLIMDVDGVLTPGYIVMGSSGDEIKFFDVYDGFGLMLWKRCGFKRAIITAGLTAAVAKRADSLKIDCVHQNSKEKLIIYEKLKKRFGMKDENICFIGDDLIDLPILRKAGFACCVANAHKDIIKYVHYVTAKDGGKGAVREIIDMMLKAKGLWEKVTRDYFK